MKIKAFFCLIFLSGCGTYKPCRIGNEWITQTDANLLKNEGFVVSCPGDEP